MFSYEAVFKRVHLPYRAACVTKELNSFLG